MDDDRPGDGALVCSVTLASLAGVARAVRDGRRLTETEARTLMPDLTPDERNRVYQLLARYKDL